MKIESNMARLEELAGKIRDNEATEAEVAEYAELIQMFENNSQFVKGLKDKAQHLLQTLSNKNSKAKKLLVWKRAREKRNEKKITSDIVKENR